MTASVHILGISGSLRRASHNSGLLRAASKVLPEGVTLETFDLSALPMFNADDLATGEPDSVRKLKSRIGSADALLVATPEYNYSIPGVLKNAIDWVSRPPKQSPLNGKPLAMMGAGGMMGTVRAQQHLRQILLHNDLLLLNKPELYVARSWEKFDMEGNLTDEATLQAVRTLVTSLAAWTRRLRGERSEAQLPHPAVASN